MSNILHGTVSLMMEKQLHSFHFHCHQCQTTVQTISKVKYWSPLLEVNIHYYYYSSILTIMLLGKYSQNSKILNALRGTSGNTVAINNNGHLVISLVEVQKVIYFFYVCGKSKTEIIEGNKRLDP